MVSFQEAMAKSPTSEVHAEFESSSKKRKWEEPLFAKEFFNDQTNFEKRQSTFGIDLHLQTPFPSDKWRQYHIIQSEQIHMCNTRVNGATMKDSKRSLEPPPSDHMSLDLELNLTSETLRKKEYDNSYDANEKQSSGSSGSFGEHDDLFIESNQSSKCKEDSDGLIRSPLWLSSEGEHKEMVATVCMRCHMLVMLCKSSPTCPNCKFMHPPDQSPSKFLKGRCSLFC